TNTKTALSSASEACVLFFLVSRKENSPFVSWERMVTISSSGCTLVSLSSLLLLLFTTLCEARTVAEHGVGRQLDDELARAVDADPEAYYQQMTTVWRQFTQEQSESALKRWKS